MNSRRDFLKQVAALGATGALPAGVRRALAIEPIPGSTWKDAAHVVILMQENRSFDHCFGSLRGVRGFSDPRAISLPDGLPVWLQTDAQGRTFSPFPLGFTGTRSTWLPCLPHSWADQTEARNHGHYDRWLSAKAPSKPELADLPQTLGYYTRQDLPFHYALADAFTLCDQAFCSSLTGTTPNRLFLWTGTVRPDAAPDSPAALRNSDVDFGRDAHWTTFPERLEAEGVPWKIYQNEISLPSGLSGENEAWLSNFSDNPLEWFPAFGVRFSPARQAWRTSRLTRLGNELKALKNLPAEPRTTQEMQRLEREMDGLRQEEEAFSTRAWDALPEERRSLHRRAFTTNSNDPQYRSLTQISYQQESGETTMDAPAGDILHQFRADVSNGELPAVSWLVAPQHFSDHPESPWYGAWYLGEVFGILSQRPEVWQKTIFILCYDENDGWFDHVPPPVPSDPADPSTGDASPGLSPGSAHITAAHEAAWRKQNPKGSIATGPIGLGYRVPLLVASPWSRGGAVCSQVFDHTSIVQFLETWLTHRTGTRIHEPNLEMWRRAICGDLTSVFEHPAAIAPESPMSPGRDAWLATVHQTRDRPIPITSPLTPAEKAAAPGQPRHHPRIPRQETGLRPSRALPYELQVIASPSPDSSSLQLQFTAANRRFGARAAGAVFQVYFPTPASRTHTRPTEASPDKNHPNPQIEETESSFAPSAAGARRPQSFTAAPGTTVRGSFPLPPHPQLRSRVHVHGPNGFFRSWNPAAGEPIASVLVESAQPPPDNAPNHPGLAAPPLLRHQLKLTLTLHHLSKPGRLHITDSSYGQPPRSLALTPSFSPHPAPPLPSSGLELSGSTLAIDWNCAPSHGWYDLLFTLESHPSWEFRIAGRIEDGLPSFSDPALGT